MCLSKPPGKPFYFWSNINEQMKPEEKVLRVAITIALVLIIDQTQFNAQWITNGVVAYLFFTVFTGECVIREYLSKR